MPSNTMLLTTIPVAFQADPPGETVKAGKKSYVAPRINFSENLEVVAGICEANPSEGTCTTAS